MPQCSVSTGTSCTVGAALLHRGVRSEDNALNFLLYVQNPELF